jgi:peptidoglycan/xylan/chitin deacetylase (PgdA/CDA1 family)
LLYHHVDPDTNSTLYNVPPSQFEAQMKALADWGYTTITISELVAAINKGVRLPPRPIVITFDDGNHSVYEYAFPIMEKNGFVGVNYLVTSWVDAQGYLGISELDELYASGWEVGSHSYSHADLQLDHTVAFYEMRHSKIDLAALLEQPVNTFAYPFGTFDDYLGDRVERWGYQAAVGLGKSYVHYSYSLFYLPRIEIKHTFDLEQFGALLPWSSPP